MKSKYRSICVKLSLAERFIWSFDAPCFAVARIAAIFSGLRRVLRGSKCLSDMFSAVLEMCSGSGPQPEKGGRRRKELSCSWTCTPMVMWKGAGC